LASGHETKRNNQRVEGATDAMTYPLKIKRNLGKVLNNGIKNGRKISQNLPKNRKKIKSNY
jgi:ribosomal protein L22